MRGFRDFILRGNVVDLAVGIVIGVAFGALVTQFVGSFITPLLAAIDGKPDFGALQFTVNNSAFRYGLFINALIAFLLIAAAVYFFVITPVNRLMARYRPSPAEPGPTRDCPHCASSIPAAAGVCAFCTRDVNV